MALRPSKAGGRGVAPSIHICRTAASTFERFFMIKPAMPMSFCARRGVTACKPQPTSTGPGCRRGRQAVGGERQRGNAILFTLLAMVIGGIVVSVGIAQYQDADRAATVQSTVAEVNAIIGNAKQNYGQYAYNALTTSVAVGSRVIPEHLQVSNAAANNKFGGAINLVDHGATTQGTALLTYAGVPRDLCSSLVNGTHGLARRVIVAGADVKPLDGAVDVGAMNAQCTSASAVSVAWVLGRT